MTKAELENMMRKELLNVVRDALAKYYDLGPEQIRNVSASEITLPIIDAERNEKWPIVKISIPRGTRNGSGSYTPYDGDAAADAYAAELEEKAAKRAASAARKEADEKLRQQKREARQVKKAIENLEKAVKEAEAE